MTPVNKIPKPGTLGMLELKVGSELPNSVAKWPDVIPLGVPSVGMSDFHWAHSVFEGDLSQPGSGWGCVS